MARSRIDTNSFSLRDAVLSAMTPSEIHWIAGDRGWSGHPGDQTPIKEGGNSTVSPPTDHCRGTSAVDSTPPNKKRDEKTWSMQVLRFRTRPDDRR